MIFVLIVGAILLLFLWYVIKPRPKDENGFKMWFFNEKSWHARYYKWVISDDLPQGGCAYFWSIVALVAFSEIIFSVWLIHEISVKFCSLFPEKKEKQKTAEEWEAYWDKKHKQMERKAKTVEIIGKVLVGIVILGILTAIIVGIIHAKTKDFITILIALGCIAFGVGVIILLRWVWLKLNLGYGLLKVLKPLGYPFKYMWSMIVAIYTRSCPKITWHK